MSSISETSSPITCIAPPQHGQRLSSTSTTISTRGRCAGRAPRLRCGGLRSPGRLLVGWRFRLDCRLREAERLFDLFQRELQLIRIELLRTRAVAAAHQLLDDQLQFLDLGIGGVALRPERVALDAQPLYGAVLRFQHRRQRREPRLEQNRILQRLAGVEEHAPIILAIVDRHRIVPSTRQ